jgi:hypothetical protein
VPPGRVGAATLPSPFAHGEMSSQALQWLALSGAGWTGMLSFALRGGRRGGVRFALGLGLGALLAHAGWAMLHWRAVAVHPGALLDPSSGYCVLFAPLGVLLFTRSPAAFRALPLAFAVARAGCLAAGCCRGPGGEPTPLYEMGGLVLLHALVWQSSDRWAVSLFCAGFGLVRLGVEPWRATPPLGEPAISPAWIAAAWVAAGVALASRESIDEVRPVGRPQGPLPRGGRNLSNISGKLHSSRKFHRLLPMSGAGGREEWDPG